MPKKNEMNRRIDTHARRMVEAERHRPTLLRHTVFLGTLGLLFILPVVGGAYLGHWLDSMASGYSVRWTTSLILLGIVVGAVNVYLFIRET